jgi:hypothetical protein
MKPELRLCTGAGSRRISRRAAASLLRAARILQRRDARYTMAYSRRAGIVRGEGPTGDWQLEHARGAA